jgi:LPXTG-motif cell wall-anchored protein
MRWKTSAGVLMALAFLIPTAPAMAQTESPGLNAACQTADRKVYTDISSRVTINLDTATDVEVRVLANQIMARADVDELPGLPDATQDAMDGTPAGLRAFLKTDLQTAWLADLRLLAYRTLTDAGANVNVAAQQVLGVGTIDALLAYLNDGLYAARTLDCAARPTPTPSVTTTVASVPTSSGEGGELPVTGADTGAVAGIGGALLLLGGAGYLVGRRRRSRFVA